MHVIHIFHGCFLNLEINFMDENYLRSREGLVDSVLADEGSAVLLLHSSHKAVPQLVDLLVVPLFLSLT